MGSTLLINLVKSKRFISQAQDQTQITSKLRLSQNSSQRQNWNSRRLSSPITT